MGRKPKNQTNEPGETPPGRRTDFQSKFGEILDNYIAEHGLSQKDVAEALQRHQSRLSRWKMGHGEPNPSDLARMVRVFGVSYDYLCDADVTHPTGRSSFSPDANEPRGERADLTPDERVVLRLMRKLGADATIDRLIAAPGETPYQAQPKISPESGREPKKK